MVTVYDSKKEKNIPLTLSEVKLITGALDFCGDKVADANGYSAGEKYWNLCDVFQQKKEKSIFLTLSEVKLIASALNYCGDKTADVNGYSAGEKYWDLCTKFQKIFNFILEY